jgi:hypothetical protein
MRLDVAALLFRRVIGDRREAAYRAAGKDCYLFTLNDEIIIDSTVGGNIARFTVRFHSPWCFHHCCCTQTACSKDCGDACGGCVVDNLQDGHAKPFLNWLALYIMQNHSCAPSLYIKVLEVDGRGRLLFFARHDIAMGQVERPQQH